MLIIFQTVERPQIKPCLRSGLLVIRIQPGSSITQDTWPYVSRSNWSSEFDRAIKNMGCNVNLFVMCEAAAATPAHPAPRTAAPNSQPPMHISGPALFAPPSNPPPLLPAQQSVGLRAFMSTNSKIQELRKLLSEFDQSVTSLTRQGNKILRVVTEVCTSAESPQPEGPDAAYITQLIQSQVQDALKSHGAQFLANAANAPDGPHMEPIEEEENEVEENEMDIYAGLESES